MQTVASHPEANRPGDGPLIRKGYLNIRKSWSAHRRRHCDRAPLQIGQFRVGQSRSRRTSASCSWKAAGRQHYRILRLPCTSCPAPAIDCHEKRGQPGYLFVIGDEVPTFRQRGEVERIPRRPSPGRHPVEEIIAAAAALRRTSSTQDDAALGNETVSSRWTQLLGQNVLQLKTRRHLRADASTIGVAEERIDPLAAWKATARGRRTSTIARAVSHGSMPLAYPERSDPGAPGAGNREARHHHGRLGFGDEGKGATSITSVASSTPAWSFATGRLPGRPNVQLPDGRRTRSPSSGAGTRWSAAFLAGRHSESDGPGPRKRSTCARWCAAPFEMLRSSGCLVRRTCTSGHQLRERLAESRRHVSCVMVSAKHGVTGQVWDDPSALKTSEIDMFARKARTGGRGASDLQEWPWIQ